MIPMWLLWLILTIVFMIVEAVTLGLTTAWCALGSFVAMILALCGLSTNVQIVVMLVVTIVSFIVSMIWIKPQVDKLTRKSKNPTNADRIIGQEGVVIKAINSVDGVGQVKVMGQVWSAKAAKDFAEGTKVKVISFEGVKIVVEEA